MSLSQSREERLCEELLHERRLFSHSRFPKHVYDTVRSATAYTWLQKWITYFRRFRLVTLILRVLTVLLTVIETGALVLLGSALVLLLLPPLIFFLLGVLLTSLFETARTNRFLLHATAQKRIYVLFLPEKAGDFFAANARELATRRDCAVIVVSPFWLSARGIRKGAFFCTARTEAPNLYLVRRYYFFSLKKRVLSHRSVAYLY